MVMATTLNPPAFSSLQESQPCRYFEFPDIQLATHDFDESLVTGRGGFGKVYRATISNGSTLVDVAIKRLDPMSNQGANEFWAEVEMLSKLRHCNLVSLIGYCNYGKEMILVYEYMPNGTLEDHLHKLGTPLSWLQRLNICIGAARGLHYLHTGTGIEVGVIHRDVKSSNILLHESWAAKISDFGLSRISPTNQPSTYVNTLIKGTFGYLDPDYYATGKLTRKSDVYAFGVVLLEVLCRKPALDRSLAEERCNLARWAQESIKEGNLKHIIDSDIMSQISTKCLKDFIRIAERCLHGNPKQRSTMAEVVVHLESVRTLQEKFDNSLQRAGRTLFGRMLDMFHFSLNGENSVQGDSKLSGNNKENIESVGSTGGADQNMLPGTTEVPEDYKLYGLKEFMFADLKTTTNNFSRDLCLGKGGCGGVFLAWVDKNTFSPSRRGVGIAVAAERFSEASCQRYTEWQTEMSLVGRLVHPNIISLLGYCGGKHEFLLVYEYMENRNFDRFLFTNSTNIAKSLSWGTRLMIMIGVARGLTYLHSSKNQVIWRGVKTTNILLDQDFNAKLWDCGLAKRGNEIGKTYFSRSLKEGYIYEAPEYMETGRLTVKSDIYGFGVVLPPETLTAQRAYDQYRKWNTEKQTLLDWAIPLLTRRKKLEFIIDPRLEHNYPLEAALKYAELILRCLASKPKDRPSSEEVLQSLEQIYATN